MGEDILQPHEPEQHPPVGLGGQRVADDVELDDAAALLQAGCLVPSCVGRQQAGLRTREGVVSQGGRPTRVPYSCRPAGQAAYLRPQHGSRVGDGEHDLID